MKINFLKANNGDAILISLKEEGKTKNILIDSGIGNTYLKSKNKKGKPEDGDLKKTIEEIQQKKQKINLLILTHVDDDHIGGILKWFAHDLNAHRLIDQVWFNSGKLIAEYFGTEKTKGSEIKLKINTNTNTSIGQGIAFEKYLKENNIWDRKIIRKGMVFEKFGLKFQILSPDDKKLKKLLKKWDKEKPDYRTSGKMNDYNISLREHIKNDTFKQDQAAHNGSSIAFIMSWGDKKWLFLADAHPSVIVDSLLAFGFSEQEPLEVEFVKLSHHGSKANNSGEMLRMVKADKYIVSTDGSKHNHPDKQMLGRLINIHPNCKIYFNYYGQRFEQIFSDQDRIDFQEFKTKEIKEEFKYENEFR